MPRLAITMGDPAGIGPELCLRLLSDESIARRCVPWVFGDIDVLRRLAEVCGLPAPNDVISLDQWRAGKTDVAAGGVVHLGELDADSVQAGMVNAATGRASYSYVDAAIEAALAGQVDALVTGPINKEAWHAAGIPYPGHTELLIARTGAQRACMMLTSPSITCSLVTAHVGYQDVLPLLSTARVLEVIQLTAAALARIVGRAPRLAVCGLNPHAGEHGLFGDGEEERIIRPAIESASQEGIDVSGPLPPDTAFVPNRRRETDGYVCMYHDQGLIPLKALAFDDAVNVTLGLPIIRTSVDHGTALDIAWQGTASVGSMVQAIDLACRLCGQRH